MPLGVYFLLLWVLTLLLLGDFFGGGGPDIGPDMGPDMGPRYGGGSRGLAEDPFVKKDMFGLEKHWPLSVADVDESSPENDVDESSPENDVDESSPENGKTPKNWNNLKTAIRIFYCAVLFAPLIVGAGIVVVSVTS